MVPQRVISVAAEVPIPIVTPAWLLACKETGKMVRTVLLTAECLQMLKTSLSPSENL
jgi:hypothetical protein